MILQVNFLSFSLSLSLDFNNFIIRPVILGYGLGSVLGSGLGFVLVLVCE